MSASRLHNDYTTWHGNSRRPKHSKMTRDHCCCLLIPTCIHLVSIAWLIVTDFGWFWYCNVHHYISYEFRIWAHTSAVCCGWKATLPVHTTRQYNICLWQPGNNDAEVLSSLLPVDPNSWRFCQTCSGLRPNDAVRIRMAMTGDFGDYADHGHMSWSSWQSWSSLSKCWSRPWWWPVSLLHFENHLRSGLSFKCPTPLCKLHCKSGITFTRQNSSCHPASQVAVDTNKFTFTCFKHELATTRTS